MTYVKAAVQKMFQWIITKTLERNKIGNQRKELKDRDEPKVNVCRKLQKVNLKA
jgi:hypothetical protein